MNQVEQVFGAGSAGSAGSAEDAAAAGAEDEAPGTEAPAPGETSAQAKSAGAKETMIQRMRRTPLTPPTVGLMVTVHVLAFAALTQPFKLSYVPIMIGIYAWCMLGNTLYLHRGIAHRAFEMTLPVKLFFTPSLFVGLLGEPVGWAAIHRHHHRTSDTPDDLHSPRHGFWFAHAVWFHKLPREGVEHILAYAKDVRKDPILRLAHNPAVFLLGHIAAAGVMYALLGLSGLLWCLYVPLVLVNHVESMINSVCHSPRFGYRSFETRDDSRNVAWLGPLTLGDSFHNNHHHVGRRARHGIAWYEIDITAGVIYVLEKLRLVKNVSW